MTARSAAPGRCPICNAERAPRFRPFCSARCAEIDLGRWFSGRYAIPAEEADEPGEAPPAPPRPDA